MKICGIYKITSPSGKIYIGQSININKRKVAYKNGHCKTQTHIYNSIKKYGWENHSFEIISECSEHDLNKLELYYIELHQSFNSKYGMNLRSGGNGTKFSDESIKKMIKSRTGKKLSESHVAKMKAWKRPPMSEETKRKISEILKGKKRTPEANRLNSIRNTGKKHTLESIRKMIISRTGTKRSEDTKKRMSESQKGRIHSEETKRKISLAKTGIKAKNR